MAGIFFRHRSREYANEISDTRNARNKKDFYSKTFMEFHGNHGTSFQRFSGSISDASAVFGGRRPPPHCCYALQTNSIPHITYAMANSESSPDDRAITIVRYKMPSGVRHNSVKEFGMKSNDGTARLSKYGLSLDYQPIPIVVSVIDHI